MREMGGTVTIAQTGQLSGAFQLPDWALFAGLLIPDLDAAVVYLHASLDGTNYYPVLDLADGGDAVLCASGSDPGYINISDLVSFLPKHTYYKVYTSAAQNTQAVTIYWYCAG